MYVAIEGIDTAGKGTQVDLLKREFSAFFTKEPFSNATREFINNGNDVVTDAAMLIDRTELYERHLHRELNSHQLVITDRSMVSGMAYRSKHMSLQESIKLNLHALQGTTIDLTVILVLDKETLTKRLSEKHNDYIESKGVNALLKIQDNLLLNASHVSNNILIVDASKSIESIHEIICNHIRYIRCLITEDKIYRDHDYDFIITSKLTDNICKIKETEVSMIPRHSNFINIVKGTLTKFTNYLRGIDNYKLGNNDDVYTLYNNDPEIEIVWEE